MKKDFIENLEEIFKGDEDSKEFFSGFKKESYEEFMRKNYPALYIK